jgi:hypothetical protein
MVWWFLMFFTLPSMIDEYNRDVAIMILKDMKSV